MIFRNAIYRTPAAGAMAWLLVSCVLMLAASVVLGQFGDYNEWGYWKTASAIVINTLVFGLTGVLSRPFITGGLRGRTPSRMTVGTYLSVLIIVVMIQPLVECCSVVNKIVCEIPMMHDMVGDPDHSADSLLLRILKFDSVADWAVALAVIAVLPGVCEELCFRWALLPALRRSAGSWHIAILSSAAIFSLVHGDAYGVLPRMVLGGVMGALFFITRDIRASMLFHVANNAMVVVTIGLADKSPAECLQMDAETPNIFVALLTTAFALGELYCVDLVCRRRKELDDLLGDINKRNE